VLLDVVMEPAGTEALKKIMAFDKGAKVIMVSAVGQDALIKEAFKAAARVHCEAVQGGAGCCRSKESAGKVSGNFLVGCD